MNWTYVTETLFAKYQLHNTAVGLCFFLVLCFIYVKFSINANDNNHKFNFIGGQLADLKRDNKTIIDKVNEHDVKISNIDTELKITKTHLEEKWREFRDGRKEEADKEKVRVQ